MNTKEKVCISFVKYRIIVIFALCFSWYYIIKVKEKIGCREAINLFSLQSIKLSIYFAIPLFSFIFAGRKQCPGSVAGIISYARGKSGQHRMLHFRK